MFPSSRGGECSSVTDYMVPSLLAPRRRSILFQNIQHFHTHSYEMWNSFVRFLGGEIWIRAEIDADAHGSTSYL
jgi:hypothetical protein